MNILWLWFMVGMLISFGFIVAVVWYSARVHHVTFWQQLWMEGVSR